MSYILCLGFGVKIYKQSPKIRIFLNNNFLDEFDINGVENTNDPTLEVWSDNLKESRSKHGRLNPEPHTLHLHKVKKYFNNATYLKFFELDKNYIDSIEKHNLRIQVFNDDNNFTNGFITKSTLISLFFVQIVPKKLLLDYSNLTKNHQLLLTEIRSKQKKVSEILNYYTNYSYIFDILNYMTQNKKEKLIWYNEKKQMFKYMFFETIGLSGYTELFFGKKLYTYDKNQLEKDELATTFFYSLGNKYSQYENQRSNS